MLGIWTDQYGGRVVYTLVMITSAIATWLLTFAYDYTTFLIAALGVGIAGRSHALDAQRGERAADRAAVEAALAKLQACVEQTKAAVEEGLGAVALRLADLTATVGEGFVGVLAAVAAEGAETRKAVALELAGTDWRVFAPTRGEGGDVR